MRQAPVGAAGQWGCWARQLQGLNLKWGPPPMTLPNARRRWSPSPTTIVQHQPHVTRLAYPRATRTLTRNTAPARRKMVIILYLRLQYDRKSITLHLHINLEAVLRKIKKTRKGKQKDKGKRRKPRKQNNTTSCQPQRDTLFHSVMNEPAQLTSTPRLTGPRRSVSWCARAPAVACGCLAGFSFPKEVLPRVVASSFASDNASRLNGQVLTCLERSWKNCFVHHFAPARRPRGNANKTVLPASPYIVTHTACRSQADRSFSCVPPGRGSHNHITYHTIIPLTTSVTPSQCYCRLSHVLPAWFAGRRPGGGQRHCRGFYAVLGSQGSRPRSLPRLMR